MKPILFLVLGTSLTVMSCSNSTSDPEYAEYKKQQEAGQGNPSSPYGNTDPYGSAVTNPYGVPGAGTQAPSEVGRYTSQNPAPYQPLPSAPNDPAPTRAGFPTIPGPGTGAPTGPTTTHIVTTGDSLWGLARKYGTTVEAIQQANGLSGSTIQTGRTLQIPGN